MIQLNLNQIAQLWKRRRARFGEKAEAAPEVIHPPRRIGLALGGLALAHADSAALGRVSQVLGVATAGRQAIYSPTSKSAATSTFRSVSNAELAVAPRAKRPCST